MESKFWKIEPTIPQLLRLRASGSPSGSQIDSKSVHPAHTTHPGRRPLQISNAPPRWIYWMGSWDVFREYQNLEELKPVESTSTITRLTTRGWKGGWDSLDLPKLNDTSSTPENKVQLFSTKISKDPTLWSWSPRRATKMPWKRFWSIWKCPQTAPSSWMHCKAAPHPAWPRKENKV